ncbi:hypothetical protein Hypma_000112 [Hypsizygus marmoreus]|uniref:Restriction endonuclease domain-containing protein n=1 Tax=Hypsizygus marmoreus TaxID=39966 RepID=A0A369KDN7_HYPMA|nr:hypothetical protein Hypma_000112 [Hypsizygus marmoreus]
MAPPNSGPLDAALQYQGQSAPSICPSLSSVAKVRACVNGAIAEQKAMFTSFQVSEDDLQTIVAFLQGREYKQIRITCSDDYNLILRFMPGFTHGAMVQTLTYMIVSALTASPHLPPGFHVLSHVVIAGGATVQLNFEHKRYKEPDQSFYPGEDFSWPLVVIEIGVAEALRELETDARHWLSHTPVLNMVILMTIGPQVAVPDIDELPVPCINIIHYEKVVSTNDRNTGPQVEVRKTFEKSWTAREVISDYCLPLRYFFLEGSPRHQALQLLEGDPQIVVPLKEILVLRGIIRDSWHRRPACG